MEMTEGLVIHQVLVKFLDGKHKALNFTTPSISTLTLKHKIQSLTSIPSHLQLLLPFNSFYPLQDHQALYLTNGLPDNRNIGSPENLTNLSPEKRNFPVVVNLLLRLRGGKGGFGSLLRGAATKAGQKKTNNFDACRDMSGRRLRHVNAEKKLEEWRAEAEERKLEKMADEFLKKNAKEAAKKGKKGATGSNTDKYVQKYREDSAKCMEEVDRSVRESLKGFVSSKRKGVELNESESKKLKIWKGKRIMGDSDSEDLDDDDCDEEEEEKEKSIVIDNGGNSDSNGEAEGSLDSVTGRKVDGGASESGSEEEKDTLLLKNLEPGKDVNVNAVHHESESLSSLTPDSPENTGQSAVASSVGTDIASVIESIQTEKEASGASEPIVVEGSSGVKENNAAKPSNNLSPISEPQEDAVSKDSELEKPLNFEQFSSAAELEVLGMEKLKSELQVRGLKCGGTLQERAARLFLLKTTPLEMLPKKLLAKK
nr:replication stress response regulator SDE2 [Solanum lycopersicum]